MPEEENKDLTPAELEALVKDLQEVLVKHGAEMGVTSTIRLMRAPIVSPYVSNEKTEDGLRTETETEEGSKGDN